MPTEKDSVVNEIVDKLVKQGVVLDDPDSRALAAQVVREVTRSRIKRLVRLVMEDLTGEVKSMPAYTHN